MDVQVLPGGKTVVLLKEELIRGARVVLASRKAAGCAEPP